VENRNACEERLRTSTCAQSAIERDEHVEAVLAVVRHARERARAYASHASDGPTWIRSSGTGSPVAATSRRSSSIRSRGSGRTTQ
jgi:hypothetical protein